MDGTPRLPNRMRLRECEVVYRSRSIDVVVRRIGSSEDVYRLLGALQATHRVAESLWVVLLDTRGKLIAVHECARGGISSVLVEIAEVFRAALLVGASSVVIAHNHPSGEPTPSPEDHAFTTRVREAGRLLGISVADHVIVSSAGYFSFVDSGLWTQLPA